MAQRKNTRSRQQYQSAYELEKAGDEEAALKGYQKATSTDPTNIQAWNRQIILFRKIKTKQQEITLIKTAIAEYKKSVESNHQQWLKVHQEKADDSFELARVLDLIEPDGIPKTEHAILEKWETRRYLLEYRIKHMRPKKAKPVKKASPGSPFKKRKTKPLKAASKTRMEKKATTAEKP